MWLLESLNTARQMAREASWGPGFEFHWGYKGKENGNSRDYIRVIWGHVGLYILKNLDLGLGF